jgi:hypothetical protein
MFPFVRTVDQFFEDAGAGTLPNVTFVTPWVGGPFRTDDHPRGDIGLGQRFIEAIYRFHAVAAVATGHVHPHVRRMGRLLRPRAAPNRA